MAAVVNPFLFPTQEAKAQSVSTPFALYGSFQTLSATTVALSTDVALTSGSMAIQGDHGIAFFPSFVLNGASTGNVTFRFAVSYDGVTWSTTTPVTYTVAANGTTPVKGFVAFGTKDGIANVKYIRLASVNNAATNGLTTLTLRNAYFQHSE